MDLPRDTEIDLSVLWLRTKDFKSGRRRTLSDEQSTKVRERENYWAYGLNLAKTAHRNLPGFDCALIILNERHGEDGEWRSIFRANGSRKVVSVWLIQLRVNFLLRSCGCHVILFLIHPISLRRRRFVAFQTLTVIYLLIILRICDDFLFSVFPLVPGCHCSTCSHVIIWWIYYCFNYIA